VTVRPPLHPPTPDLATNRETATPARVRVAVAGLGHQTRGHLLPTLLGLDRALLCAVADPHSWVRDDIADRLDVPAA
jgi:hypothetical protein